VALTYDLLRPLLPPNQSLRSLRLDCARLDDAAISCLVRPSLHELVLLHCENISGRLLCELGATCRDLRYCMLRQIVALMLLCCLLVKNVAALSALAPVNVFDPIGLAKGSLNPYAV
jgi:hypothetical protein